MCGQGSDCRRWIGIAAGQLAGRPEIGQCETVAAAALAFGDPDLLSGIAGAAEIDAQDSPRRSVGFRHTVAE